jgi:hypothetical protein
MRNKTDRADQKKVSSSEAAGFAGQHRLKFFETSALSEVRYFVRKN